MQIKIVTVDFQISSRAKKAIRWLLLPAAVFAGSVAVSRADPLNVDWIGTGKPIPAASMSAALTGLDARITALGQPKYAGTGALTIGGASYGNGGGACAAGSHICTQQEIIVLKQTPVTIPAGWVSAGWAGNFPHAATPGGTLNVYDCDGWGNIGTTDTQAGVMWSALGFFEPATCDGKGLLTGTVIGNTALCCSYEP